jgi:hypothetical protein
MSGPAPVLLIVAGIGLVVLLVVLVVVSVRQERERQDRIRRWAMRHGWTVAARPAVDWATRLPGAERRGVSLLVSGMVHGWPVGVAEYSYTTESMADSRGSRSTTTHYLIVTGIRLAAPHPPLAVQPRGGFSRLGRVMFGDNAAATGHDAFDRQFRVQTKDPASARTLLGPALIVVCQADGTCGLPWAWDRVGSGRGPCGDGGRRPGCWSIRAGWFGRFGRVVGESGFLSLPVGLAFDDEFVGG